MSRRHLITQIAPHGTPALAIWWDAGQYRVAIALTADATAWRWLPDATFHTYDAADTRLRHELARGREEAR